MISIHKNMNVIILVIVLFAIIKENPIKPTIESNLKTLDLEKPPLKLISSIIGAPITASNKNPKKGMLVYLLKELSLS
ncbi:hypothetical protein GCM10022271_04920 [Corallibacter vietnamensis]|uniref:Uncharacterized protein n=1 Tax=Corallibacter vietnamensis TaxID=904130 RepID=A0ABP7GWD3_9FLAO